MVRRIDGLRNQIAMAQNKRNTIIRVNRASKTAMEVFDDILSKEKLERNDLQLIAQKIKVYEDRIEIMLKADVDSLLQCGTLPAEGEEAANFKLDTMDISPDGPIPITQSSAKRRDKVYRVNVISSGEHLKLGIPPRRRSRRYAYPLRIPEAALPLSGAALLLVCGYPGLLLLHGPPGCAGPPPA